MGQYYKPLSLEKMEHVCSMDFDNGPKLMEHSWIGNYFVAAVESLIVKGGRWFGDRIVWAGDYADPEPNQNDQNLYHLTSRFKPTPKETDFQRKNRFLRNLDTNEWVDLNKIPDSQDHWGIHPLPLLTCEGNGRGGGDFLGDDPKDLIGKWSRNRVVIQRTKPKKGDELIFDLVGD